MRDVITFSFQYAPRKVLERSGIAWPNARIFQKVPSSPYPRSDMDAHAHSPQRAEKPVSGTIGTKCSPKQHGIPIALQDSKWARKLQMIPDDPFVAPGTSSQTHRKTSDDISMADYTAYARSSKNPSEMSGVALQQLNFPQQMQRAAAEEILQELSPAKKRALVDLIMSSKSSESASMKSTANFADEMLSASDGAQKPPTVRSSSVQRRSSTGSRRSASGQSATMS